MASGICLTTDRLAIRSLRDGDRDRFVELFTNASFMVYAGGPCDVRSAHKRFDRMLQNAACVGFSKRPIIERSSGHILGYVGVAPYVYDGTQRLEFGYRLCNEARGKGYATEAAMALLDAARTSWTGVLLAMIEPTNAASINVITKLGFSFWKQAPIEGRLDNLYQLNLA